MVITGKEKAFIGGLGAGITTLAGQLQVGGKLDVQTVAWSVGAWVATHLFVYYATNSPVEPEAPEAAQLSPTPPAPTDPAPSV